MQGRARLATPLLSCELPMFFIHRSQRGFSLTELMLTVAIAATIMGMAVPVLTDVSATIKLNEAARMIEREEYCIDILQQTSALRAAVDSLSIMLLEDHVQGCVRTAAARGEADQYVDEVIDVVRRTLGRPVRSGARSA